MSSSPFYRTSYERNIVVLDIKPIVTKIETSLILPYQLKIKHRYNLLEAIMTNSECNQEQSLLDIGVNLVAESASQEAILDEIIKLMHLRELLLFEFLSSVKADNLLNTESMPFGYNYYRMQNLLVNRYARLIFDINEIFLKDGVA